MKKKLMMVAVLLGALSLGACVDNDESASVTAVRNAKAEQLKGLADWPMHRRKLLKLLLKQRQH